MIQNSDANWTYQLPANNQIHNVFHVSQLKDYHPNFTPIFAELPKLPALDTVDVELESILDRRMMKKGNTPVVQVLIKWTNMPAEAATCEDWDVLKVKHPSILTWGQVSTSPGAVSHTTTAHRRHTACVTEATRTCDTSGEWAMGQLCVEWARVGFSRVCCGYLARSCI
jgi:hypothetical protein